MSKLENHYVLWVLKTCLLDPRCQTYVFKTKIAKGIQIWVQNKEYIERRHGEPFKFLFLPKMGLLGSQAVLEKKVQF